MRYQSGFLVIFIFVAFNTLSAQESNLNEDLSAYLPEVKTANKFARQMTPPPSVLTKDGLQKTRNMMKMYVPSKTVIIPQQKTIKGPGGDIRLVIFKPDTIRAVVLDIHGGAWIMGAPENDGALNDEMARICKVAVVSVDYRLAPEAPFPACIEDCNATAKWIIENAKAQFNTENIFISGGSAGAHLAALTTIYIRDSLKAIDKIKGVNLVYGCFDLGRTPSLRKVSDTTVALNKKMVDEGFQLVFTGWSLQKKQDPAYSPLYANLKGLPPALFTVGTADPLIDDTYFMEDLWRNAGNKTFLAVYPECGHVFNFLPIRMAKAANQRMYTWIKSLIK